MNTAKTDALWNILRTANCMTEQSCSLITRAKEELRRRGYAVV